MRKAGNATRRRIPVSHEGAAPFYLRYSAGQAPRAYS